MHFGINALWERKIQTHEIYIGEKKTQNMFIWNQKNIRRDFTKYLPDITKTEHPCCYKKTSWAYEQR